MIVEGTLAPMVKTRTEAASEGTRRHLIELLFPKTCRYRQEALFLAADKRQFLADNGITNN